MSVTEMQEHIARENMTPEQKVANYTRDAEKYRQAKQHLMELMALYLPTADSPGLNPGTNVDVIKLMIGHAEIEVMRLQTAIERLSVE